MMGDAALRESEAKGSVLRKDGLRTGEATTAGLLGDMGE